MANMPVKWAILFSRSWSSKSLKKILCKVLDQRLPEYYIMETNRLCNAGMLPKQITCLHSLPLRERYCNTVLITYVERFTTFPLTIFRHFGCLTPSEWRHLPVCFHKINNGSCHVTERLLADIWLATSTCVDWKTRASCENRRGVGLVPNTMHSTVDSCHDFGPTHYMYWLFPLSLFGQRFSNKWFRNDNHLKLQRAGIARVPSFGTQYFHFITSLTWTVSKSRLLNIKGIIKLNLLILV